MASPVNPSQPPQGASAPPTDTQIDPTGVWQRFLSASGTQATPQDVQTFMQGLLKMFSIVIQQQQEAAQRANQNLKEIAEGDQ